MILMIKVAYICDQKKPCHLYKHCGKVCVHTFDEFHTANGIVHDIHELETNRFRLVTVSDECTYYEEVEEWQSNISAIDAEEEEENTNCSQ